jgi:hypothetical protein
MSAATLVLPPLGVCAALESLKPELSQTPALGNEVGRSARQSKGSLDRDGSFRKALPLFRQARVLICTDDHDTLPAITADGDGRPTLRHTFDERAQALSSLVNR